MRGPQHGFLCYIFRHSGEFKENAAGLYNSYPLFRRSFAAPHSYLNRLLAQSLVGEYANPHLPAAADMVRNRTSRCFDLTIVNPASFKRLKSEIAKSERGSSKCLAAAVTAMHFSVFCSFRHQHGWLYSLAPLALAFRSFGERRCRLP